MCKTANPQRTRALGVYICAAFCLLCYLGAVYISYRASAYIFDSDSSSELILSRLLSIDGGIVSRSWWYSTELRVLNTQLVYAPLFGLFSSFRTVRVVGNAILLALYAASFLFAARQSGIRWSYAFLCAGILLLPVSTAYTRIIILHAYYIPHIALGFLLAGLLLYTAKQKRGSGRHICGFEIYLLVAFLAGLGGIRQMIVTHIPLCAVTLIPLTFGKSGRLNSLRGSEELRHFLLSLFGAAASFIGCILNIIATYSTQIFHVFNTLGGTRVLAPTVENTVEVLRGLLHLFGYREDVQLVSFEGVSSILAILCIVVCLAFSVLLLVRSKALASPPIVLFGNLFLISLLVQTASMFFTGNLSFHYLIPAIAFIPALLAVMLELGDRLHAPIYHLYTGAVACAFLFASLVTGKYFVMDHSSATVRADSGIAYHGLSFKDPDITRKLRGAADYLTSNGYTYGYAYFWNCNVLQEMTDAALLPICVEFSSDCVLYRDWLTDPRYREPALQAERVFVLVTTAEASGNIYPYLSSDAIVYQDEQYTVYSFSDGMHPSTWS